MLLTTIASADGSGALAQAIDPAVVAEHTATPDFTQQIVTPLPMQPEPAPAPDVPVKPALTENDVPRAASLAALVAKQPAIADLPRELNCLAGAIYFEAKGETLAGQLAVGRVIVARSKSGRFPETYCGVVFQRAQFSFIRGSAMPAIHKASRQWKEAVAIAQIAHIGSWKSQAEGALFFHAAYVSPGWHLTRLARIDNHVFYR